MIIKDRITKFLERCQFSFNTGISTQDAIIKLLTESHTALDNHEKTIYVFVDLARALDTTVSHTKLMEALNYIGTGGAAQRLFESYLNNRT